MNVSTTIQRDLLYVLAGHQGTTERTLERTLGDYYRTEIRPDRLSSNLDALLQQGYVEAIKTTDQTGYYVLTNRGRREIEARREWESDHFDSGSENE